MKLYFAPGACSLSPHIVLREAGHQFDPDVVLAFLSVLDELDPADPAHTGAAAATHRANLAAAVISQVDELLHSPAS